MTLTVHPDEAFDFFLGGMLGMAMLAAKCEYEEQERINCRCAYYEEEFAYLDDDGNLVDPPQERSDIDELGGLSSAPNPNRPPVVGQLTK